MLHHVVPALHSCLIWWFGTCLVLLLDGFPRGTFRWSMAGATVMLLAALYALKVSAAETTTSSVYTAFTAAIVIWGWLELSFYTGYITGPRVKHCSDGCGGLRHFGHAIQASLYHEIAVLGLACVVVALTWGQPNQFGTGAFIVLWWMHQSARLNVFLGVSNLSAEFLPKHLDHLNSFFTSRPMNMLFPFSVTASTITAVVLVERALSARTGSPAEVGYVLVGTLMMLAILEHWVLVLPVSATRIWNGMWRWGLSLRARGAPLPTRQHGHVPTKAPIGGCP